MRKLIALFVLCTAVFGNVVAAERPDVARYVRAYTGGEGVTVWVLRFGPVADKEALVQINGIDHPWDGRVQRMKIEQMQSGVKYVASSGGKRLDVLWRSELPGAPTLELAVPGMPGRTALAYDKAVSAESDAQHFLTKYLEQKP